METPPQMDAATLAQQATKPKVVEVDGQRVEQHSLPDQIAFDRYLKSKEAAESRRGIGFRLAKMEAGGAIR